MELRIIDGLETLLLPCLNADLAYAGRVVSSWFLGSVKLEWIALVRDEDLRDLEEVVLCGDVQGCLLAFVVRAVAVDDVLTKDLHKLYVIVAAGPGQQALALDQARLLQVGHRLFLEKAPHSVELLGLHGCEELFCRVRIVLLAGCLEGWLQYRDISDCAPVDLYIFDANELKDCHRRVDATVTSDLAALVTADHTVLLLLDEDVSVLEVDWVEETSKEERKKDVALLLDFHGDLVRFLVLSVHGHGVVICDEHVRLLSLHDLGDAVVRLVHLADESREIVLDHFVLVRVEALQVAVELELLQVSLTIEDLDLVEGYCLCIGEILEFVLNVFHFRVLSLLLECQLQERIRILDVEVVLPLLEDFLFLCKGLVLHAKVLLQRNEHVPLADLLLNLLLLLLIDTNGLKHASFGLAHQPLGFFGRHLRSLLDLVNVHVDRRGLLSLLVGVLHKELSRVMPHDLLALPSEELHEVAIVVLDLNPNGQELHLLDRHSALLHRPLRVFFVRIAQQDLDLVEVRLELLLRSFHYKPLKEARA